MTNFKGPVPGRQHREIVLVQLREGLRVVDLQLGVGDLIDPRADGLPEQLAARLTADRVGDRPDCVGWIYEAEAHR